MESTDLGVVAGYDDRASGPSRTNDLDWVRAPSAPSGGAIGLSAASGVRESKYGSVPAVWNLDLDEIGPAFGQVVFSEAFPQTVRLDPNDGVPALIEVRASAKGVDGDVVFLYIVRGTFEEFRSYVNEQLLQPGSSIENPRPENCLNFHPLFSEASESRQTLPPHRAIEYTPAARGAQLQSVTPRVGPSV